MKKKILIVDDEPSIVRLLSLRLTHSNYDVIEANNGLECVEVASNETPDLILMDTRMPECDGINAFNKLVNQEETKSIPVIFMTAFPKLDIVNKLKRMGAKGCISKPFVSADFEESIRLALN